MITVGVTGGIGSGKSTVCEVWEELGAYVLNADELAKKVMVTHPGVKQELIDTFGIESFRSDGSLNRTHLAGEAFTNNRVEELNAIVHPRLPEASLKKINEAREAGYDVFVYEAALLLENREPGTLDYIVIVLAEDEQRIQWVQDRDETTAGKIKRRMETQRDFEQAVGQADFVIHNDGSLEELRKEAEFLYHKLISNRH